MSWATSPVAWHTQQVPHIIGEKKNKRKTTVLLPEHCGSNTRTVGPEFEVLRVRGPPNHVFGHQLIFNLKGSALPADPKNI